MTPQEIILAARNKHNAVGDNFYSDAELLHLIYEACMELAKKAFAIENTYSTTVTQSQREYSYPTSTIAIMRVEYDGKKLKKIDFSQDDLVTGDDADTTSEGTPDFYSIWDETLYLRSIPDNSTSTLKIFSFNEPQTVTLNSTLEVPTLFHPAIVNYVTSEMYDKDENDAMASKYWDKWEVGLNDAIAWRAKKKRTDNMASVKTESGRDWNFPR